MELLERVVELSLEGYCCSQVMALLLVYCAVTMLLELRA